MSTKQVEEEVDEGKLGCRVWHIGGAVRDPPACPATGWTPCLSLWGGSGNTDLAFLAITYLFYPPLFLRKKDPGN